MVNQHVAPPASRPDVVVLGGGIAGIATALHLLDQGYGVTLVETRRFLGGRVFSFTDAPTGVAVDNGQHVIVGCCHNFIGLLKRLGVWERWYLQNRLHISVWDRQGKRGKLATSPLPPPFHLLPSFLTYAHLGMGDKLRIVWALARAKFTNRHRPELERMSFRQWLVAQRQTQRAMNNFWSLVITPILNDDIQDVSAAMGIMVIQEGMLDGFHNADMGYALRGLSNALGEPARQCLEELGCRVMLGSPVRRLRWDGQRVDGVELASGEVITADLYVSALPHYALLESLPQGAQQLPFFRRMEGLETSPIVNIHLWYNRPVMEGRLHRPGGQPSAVGVQPQRLHGRAGPTPLPIVRQQGAPRRETAGRRRPIHLHLPQRRLEVHRLAQGGVDSGIHRRDGPGISPGCRGGSFAGCSGQAAGRHLPLPARGQRPAPG